MTLKRLLLIRHGETEWNAIRRLQGQQDIELSTNGCVQARALAPMVARLSPDVAFTSDLRRARDTAELLGHSNAGLRVGLREQSLGEWQGREDRKSVV